MCDKIKGKSYHIFLDSFIAQVFHGDEMLGSEALVQLNHMHDDE